MEIVSILVIFTVLTVIFIFMTKDINKDINVQFEPLYNSLRPSLWTKTIKEQKKPLFCESINKDYIIIQFNDNNEINISNNTRLLKEDIINIIQEVSKLETID